MSAFSSADIARMREWTPRVAMLVQMDFASGPERLFAGAGIRDYGGFAWKGISSFVSIDGLSDGRGTAANSVTFRLSGVDPTLLPKAIGDTDEVVNRTISLFWQFLDAEEQPIGVPLPIWFGLMQPPVIDRTEASDDEGSVCSVSLPCETLMVGRAKPAQGRYTDRDQQIRAPGDRFFERIFENKGKVIHWPRF